MVGRVDVVKKAPLGRGQGAGEPLGWPGPVRLERCGLEGPRG